MKRILLAVLLILQVTNYILSQEETKVEVLSKTTSSWNGSDLPDYSEGEAEITILKITIPPKMKLPMHRHPVINAGVLIKGQLTVITAEEDTLNLKAGDPIVEVVDKWHFGLNEGGVPAEILVFYAGTKDKAITIKQD